MFKVTLIGRLGQDPVLRTTNSGKRVLNMRIASDIGPDRVVWSNVAWYEPPERVIPHLRRGRSVYLEAIPNPGEDGSPRTWIGRDGTVRSSYDLTVVGLVRLLDPRPLNEEEVDEEGTGEE